MEGKRKKFLEFNFRVGLFYEKLANSQVSLAHHMLSKMVFHDPSAPTTMEEIHFYYMA